MILVLISEITVNSNRRAANQEAVRRLADSIAELGLLNAITVDRNFVLIAGLHRLEAAKLLGWTEIECKICDLEGLKAELAEIDENFVRTDIPTLERNDILLRRKEIYETLHPEAKHGGNRKLEFDSRKIKCAKCTLDRSKSFVQDTAEKLGVNGSTVRRQLQAAKNTTEEAKKILKESKTDISQKDALKLSQLKPEQQREAATQLAAGAIKKMNEFEAAADGKDDPPFHLEPKRYATFAESVADMKNTEKDCSASSDMFLAEITGFVNRIQPQIAWFGAEYYQPVFPKLTEKQMNYLQGQVQAICSAAQNLMTLIERIRAT